MVPNRPRILVQFNICFLRMLTSNVFNLSKFCPIKSLKTQADRAAPPGTHPVLVTARQEGRKPKGFNRGFNFQCLSSGVSHPFHCWLTGINQLQWPIKPQGEGSLGERMQSLGIITGSHATHISQHLSQFNKIYFLSSRAIEGMSVSITNIFQTSVNTQQGLDKYLLNKKFKTKYSK